MPERRKSKQAGAVKQILASHFLTKHICCNLFPFARSEDFPQVRKPSQRVHHAKVDVGGRSIHIVCARVRARISSNNNKIQTTTAVPSMHIFLLCLYNGVKTRLEQPRHFFNTLPKQQANNYHHCCCL